MNLFFPYKFHSKDFSADERTKKLQNQGKISRKGKKNSPLLQKKKNSHTQETHVMKLLSLSGMSGGIS